MQVTSTFASQRRRENGALPDLAQLTGRRGDMPRPLPLARFGRGFAAAWPGPTRKVCSQSSRTLSIIASCVHPRCTTSWWYASTESSTESRSTACSIFHVAAEPSFGRGALQRTAQPAALHLHAVAPRRGGARIRRGRGAEHQREIVQPGLDLHDRADRFSSIAGPVCASCTGSISSSSFSATCT